MAVCLLLISTVTLAQGTGAAGIAGTVKDASGAVLPGVTVEAASPALIEKVRTTVTDGRGEYRILQLRPGTYNVTFTLTGFSTFKREGIELGPNFTASVNVELKIGGLEETVTVSGQSPLVDIHNTTQQATVSKTVLEIMPNSKSTFSFTALMPAAISPTNLQDVGGSNGEASIRISVHGTKSADSKLLLDGLSYNMPVGDGNQRPFLVDPLSAQEIVIDAGGGGTAEWAVGGSVVNLISRDGGNKFSATLFGSGMKRGMQSDNLTDALKAQGFNSVNNSVHIYDLDAFIGGPILQDKLWFTSSNRRNGQQRRVANLYRDANLSARVFGAPAAVWKFAPDLSKPVEPTEDDQAHNFRLTWQATGKDKVTLSYDWQWNKSQDNNGALNLGTGAWEAAKALPGSVYRCTPARLMQMTWTRPATNKLLIEAGANYLVTSLNGRGPCSWYADRIPIKDTALNFTYNGGGLAMNDWQYGPTQRASMSYTTGAHTVKVGMLAAENLKPVKSFSDRGQFPFSYTFNDGVPTQLTEFISPLEASSSVRLSLGLFVQDSWKVKRMTLTGGLRNEYINAYAPALERPATALADAASFPELDCLPCWHDIHPRVGIAYDVSGDGKTAIKFSVGRYAGGLFTTWAAPFSPSAAAVTSTTRSWSDTNGNFFPDCDPRNPLLNDECGPMANQSFGGVQVRTIPDPNWIQGWGKRPYNWQMSASVDRELLPGVAVNVGYFRTWFGNQVVTDNLLVTPADFDQYCITAPIDSRLPNSGQQLCGLYDIKPALFGQVNNLVGLASKYGKYTEHYNGVDININARLPRGARLGGGWNIGNAVALGTGLTFISSTTSRCFVVDSPQDLTYPLSIQTTAPGFANGCKTANVYQQRFKLNGSYPLPWNLQAAAVFQDLPGAYYSAFATYTTAQILPSLGRNLAGGTKTITVDLLPLYNHFVDQRIVQLDLRLSKILQLGRARLQGNLDVFNAINSSTVLTVNQTYGTDWLKPTQIMPGRMFKVGFQLDF
jgi:hypothetical protein